MEAIRITPPTFPVVTTAEIETWLRLDPNTDTSTLDLLVTSATEIVEGITNRTIGSATYEIVTDCISQLYKMPVTNISRVINIAGAGEGVMESGFILAGEHLYFHDLPLTPPTITVQAGYTNIDLIPDAIRHAIALVVSAGYNTREDIDPKTFATVERLCARYRRLTL